MVKNTQNLVKRQIFSEIARHLEAPEITLIIGPRQVGKTTLLLTQLKDHLIKKGYPENKILVFNLDVITELDLFTSQQKFINFLKERIGRGKLFVFIDEAQRVENAGIFFKGIYDLDLPVKFVLTGSSTLEIKAKIHESLTGRKRIFHLYPFTFKEFLSFWDTSLAKLISQKEISSYSKERIIEYLFTFVNWGGYPRIALETNISEKQEILKEIYSSYIEKDIIGFLKIKNHTAFTNLVSFLSAQIGQLVNTNELSQSLKTERKTIEKYLEILEKTFIIKRILPFFRNPRKELTKMPKIYFTDTGIRNFALNSFNDFDSRQDKGTLLENFIFSEICKQTNTQLRFWRTKEKAEVDFVLTNYAGIILPIEVKAISLKSPQISRSFRSFITHYQPKKALIVNLGFQGKMKLKKTNIYFIHPYEIGRILATNL